jgi:predicted RNA-binding protein
LATVYLEDDSQRQEVMRDVVWIVPERVGVQLMSFLGQSRLLQAKIKSIDLLNSSIVLEKMATDLPQVEFDSQRGDRVPTDHA